MIFILLSIGLAFTSGLYLAKGDVVSSFLFILMSLCFCYIYIDAYKEEISIFLDKIKNHLFKTKKVG